MPSELNECTWIKSEIEIIRWIKRLPAALVIHRLLSLSGDSPSSFFKMTEQKDEQLILSAWVSAGKCHFDLCNSLVINKWHLVSKVRHTDVSGPWEITTCHSFFRRSKDQRPPQLFSKVNEEYVRKCPWYWPTESSTHLGELLLRYNFALGAALFFLFFWIFTMPEFIETEEKALTSLSFL